MRVGLPDASDQRSQGAFLLQIERFAVRRYAVFLDRGGSLLESVGGARNQPQLHAFRAQALGNGAAYTARGTRDNSGAAGILRLHSDSCEASELLIETLHRIEVINRRGKAFDVEHAELIRLHCRLQRTLTNRENPIKKCVEDLLSIFKPCLIERRDLADAGPAQFFKIKLE